MSVTIKQIAEESGFSWPTVSRILNNTSHSFRPDTRKRVLEVAERMGYRPHAGARMMRSRRSRQVGVIISVGSDTHQPHPPSMEFVTGIGGVLAEAGLSMVLVPVVRGVPAAEAHTPALDQQLLDGLIVLDEVPTNIARDWSDPAKPVVYLNAECDEAACCVRRDEVAAGRVAAQELSSLGYREMLFLTSSLRIRHFSLSDRLEGVREAARELGMGLEVTAIDPRDFSLAAPAHLPEVRGRAVLASQTYLAQTMLVHAATRGYRPGTDFALACCDDAEVFHSTWPGLARVGFDRLGIGRRAAKLLVRRLESSKSRTPSLLVEGPWIAGETAPPASKLSLGATDRADELKN